LIQSIEITRACSTTFHPSTAAYHARVVIGLLETLVPESDFRQLRESLPESEANENWASLFELIDAGGWEARED
jgi:hypothetical protein